MNWREYIRLSGMRGYIKPSLSSFPHHVFANDDGGSH